MNSSDQPAQLVVNADDFGYFPNVSSGIIEAHLNGIVTSTGVMANVTNFEEQLSLLAAIPSIETGVHLNVTSGYPITDDLRQRLRKYGESFPGKFTIARLVLSGRLDIELIEGEWRAQILRCLAAGASLSFINSHEHLHVLPPLSRVVDRLAQEFSINFVRQPAAEWRGSFRPAVLIRNLGLSAANHLSSVREFKQPEIIFLGLSCSGRLNVSTLVGLLQSLKSGKLYELMCHPGFGANSEEIPNSLRNYHDWDSERLALTSLHVAKIVKERGIRIVGFRDLV